MPSVKKNFAWMSIMTIAGYVLPLITFPYVTRVLGVDGIGNYQFAVSVVQYFNIFACLGIDTIGIREIAKSKGDPFEMSRVFSNLVTLNLITTLISITALIILTFFIPSFEAHNKLLYIAVAWILTNSLVVEWLYKGLENFRYITVRAIIIRIIYVISIFIFVRKPDDYVIYFILTTLVTVVNAIINQSYARHYVTFSLKKIDFSPYIRSFIILGVYKILTSMYTSFNVLFLGSTCGDTEVGYYSTSVKMYVIFMSFFTSFTSVMLPRMSAVVADGEEKEFKRLTSKSIDFLLCFSLPIILISEIYAPGIIRIIAGEDFYNSITPMRIVMPLMLIIGYEQIFVIQMLFPLKKDNIILLNSCIGAAVALLLDFLLVPKLGSIGSAIVWCASEMAVLVSAQYFVTKHVGYRFPLKKIVNTILLTSPSALLCLLVNWIIPDWILSMALGTICVFGYFFLMEYFVIKNDLVIGLVYNVTSRIKK